MGTFRVNLEVSNPSEKSLHLKLFKNVLVDTGAEVTWLPESDLVSLGIKVFKKDEVFMMANGQRITRDIGIAILRCGEFKTVDEVVMAKPGDSLLLGARTLEGFHAVIDPRRKKLVATGPLPAASIFVEFVTSR